MKRFAVLCSIVALVSLYVPDTWATAPSVQDLPDVRLLTGGGGPPKGVISSGQLSTTEPNAYDLDQFIKDFDQAVGDLSISIIDTTMVDPPPSQSPNSSTPVPVIEIDVDNNVDVWGRASAGWAMYTVEVDDGTPAHVTTRTAVAKYSTFAMGTPSLSAGRFFDLASDGWQLAYAWMGQDVEVTDLDSTIDPPATVVSWEAYFNNIDYLNPDCYDANGDFLGLDPEYVAHGSSFTTSNGWNVAISSTGGLVLSPGPTYSPGPFLVGVLATKDGTTDDMDGTRVLVAAGLLGLATPGEGDTITHGLSETLDDCSTGAITSPTLLKMPPPIRPGSHWMYQFYANDYAPVNTTAPMEIVDLSTDPDLPTAAQPGNFKGVIGAAAANSIAGGNAIKVTLNPSLSPPPGFRLVSRAVTGVVPGEVYTFAVNVASTVPNATHSPSVLMALVSGLGTMNCGFFLHHEAFVGVPVAVGTVLEQYQKDIFPFASDGWQTLSVNYTPPLTRTYLDVDVDGDMDGDDQTLIDAVTSADEGWTDEVQAMRAQLKMFARADMTTTTYVFLDNLRIYRSAYELDLGYEKTSYTEPADLTGILPSPPIVGPSGALDGSMESYSGSLDAIGLKLETGAGSGPPHRPLFSVIDAGAGAVTVNTSVDHTKSNNSSNCLQIQLPNAGEATPNVAVRSRIVTTIVDVSGGGSGVYCMEAYVSKQRATNSVQADQTPTLTVALNQMAPNALQPANGTFMLKGGLPESVGAEDNNWLRLVGTAYIPNAQLVRGLITLVESYTEPSAWFSVPVYIDDIKLYRVDDPARFFDADLFDSI